MLFLKIINSLGMSALIEVHTPAELERVLSLEGVSLVGINNRNLEDFSVSLEITSQILAEYGQILTQKGIAVVSESGIHNHNDLTFVKNAGADAVLIGESLIKQADPGEAIASLFAHKG